MPNCFEEQATAQYAIEGSAQKLNFQNYHYLK